MLISTEGILLQTLGTILNMMLVSINYKYIYDILYLVVVAGHFEMKNKHLIENPRMFARVEFNIQKKNFQDFNMLKVGLKTNGHRVKIIFSENTLRMNIDYNFYKVR